MDDVSASSSERISIVSISIKQNESRHSYGRMYFTTFLDRHEVIRKRFVISSRPDVFQSHNRLLCSLKYNSSTRGTF